MSERDRDGGPAFPAMSSAWGVVPGGMSLRDYFAGQALLGWLGFCREGGDPGTCDPFTIQGMQEVAGNVYALADAMLAERAAGEEPGE